MPAVTIRMAGADDVSTLAEIGRRTFEQTFTDGNNPDDLAEYLARAFSGEQLTHELRSPGTRFYLASVDGSIAGYLKTNRDKAQTEQVEGNTLEIERIYVDADFQGTGVGKAMFEQALDEAKEAGMDAVWLGVWEENLKAIEFYSRQGFEAFGEHEFTIGSDVQRDILMRLSL